MRFLKLNLPVTIHGQMTIQANNTTMPTKQIIVERVDEDGFLCVQSEPIPTSIRPVGELIGSVLAKSRAYDVYVGTEERGFTVVSRLAGARTVTYHIGVEFLLRIHRIISEYTEIRFNALRREFTQAKSALQLMSALAVLKVTGLVERHSEGQAVYYRTVGDWSLGTLSARQIPYACVRVPLDHNSSFHLE